MYKDITTDDGPFEKLGSAIILQAVKDYRQALRSLAGSPNCVRAMETKTEVERFFHSDLFAAITSIEPDWLIDKLSQEVSNG